MSNFLNQGCSYCINISNGTDSHRLHICHNEIGDLTSVKDMITDADFTDAAFLTEIKNFVLGKPLTAGFTVTKRKSCEIKTKFNDYELCFEDSNGDLIVSGSISEEVDAELGEVVEIVSFEVFSTNDATNLPEGTVFRTIDGDVTYVSGSYKEGTLVMEVNGVELTQADCVTCSNCG